MDIMSILTWILLGFVAGGIAKFIMPGKDPGGWIGSIVVGVLGAFVGGYLAGVVGIGSQTGGFNVASVVTATVGALVLLALYRLVTKFIVK